ncbi:MAG: ATP-binding cassette domain-containing protein, partial [Devosia sp.]
MSEPHLRLRGVHRHYGKGDTIVCVLEAAELSVNSGELVAIVAPSGAGKSTLLHLSGLLERPQSGEIEITGTPTMQLSERGRTLLRRTTIGYVYQFHHLLPEFTALENISIPQLIAGKRQADADRRS